jgi:hypothetical protein
MACAVRDMYLVFAGCTLSQCTVHVIRSQWQGPCHPHRNEQQGGRMDMLLC